MYMKRQSVLLRAMPPILLLISLAYIYMSTIAPDLTWANRGSDGGDLITAAATNGIAHPSGYPLYLLLAHFFQLLPVGSLAFRTNLMSVFFAILTALLVYAIVVRYLLAELNMYYIACIAGLSAGYAAGFSPLFWSQAVITEVYTLQAFLIVLIVYLTILPEKTISQQQKLNRWRGLVYGLAAANHLTAILVIPGALVLNSLNQYSSPQELASPVKKLSINWKSAGRQASWTLLGLFVYLVLPLRALKHPIINWGNPINLENFWWLVSGKIYRAYYLQNTLASLWTRIEASASLVLQQFGLIGIVLGFIGLVTFYKISKLYILTIWIGAVFWITSLIYQSSDSYLYFIPAIISFSIWIGICVGLSIAYLKKHKAFLQVVFLSFLIINLFVGVIGNWENVDASQDARAGNFAKEVFALAPENAIVFAEGDQAIFSLWYFHFALDERTDLVVLATDLLHYDWYQESMIKTYPSLVLPGPFPWTSTVAAANSTRGVCYVTYDNQTEILCENVAER